MIAKFFLNAPKESGLHFVLTLERVAFDWISHAQCSTRAVMDAVSGLLILDDASLVRRAQSGDRSAFSALVERHYRLAHGCAFRRTGNRADAEDIAQDVMAKLGGAIFSLKEPAALRGFLLRLTINAVTDFFRKRSREARGNTAYFTDPSAQTFEEDSASDQDSALWAAVRQLPDQQRDAVLLVYADGASHREAGEALGCAEATVSYHVHAARKRLKILLTEDLP
jgi:RNA polymerase sigma-70 factor, ECF subfamily